jgi:DNA topoisomerase-1
MFRISTSGSPADFAKEAGLRYATDERPGITREKKGNQFVYRGPKRELIRDPETLGRIKRLAIPPAWTRVWISPIPDGHLQATGYDARGRKQYRYHPYWRQVRDENKFSRMMAFGRALPALRKRVAEDIALPGLSRRKVLATVVKLLEATLIRVGNEEYARANHSFGLTTLRDHHAKVEGDTIIFEFKGKSGKRHKIDVRDRQLARIVKRCQDLPDQEIFAYVDAHGKSQDVKSQDVNSYLREAMGNEFTAKDFRTWAGTVLAAIALRDLKEFTSQKQAKGNIVRAVESVAKMLGNTPSICRKCYVHPEVLESYLQGTTIDTLRQRSRRAAAAESSALKPEEEAVMRLLRTRLQSAAQRGPTKAKDLMKALEKSVRKRGKKPR